MREIDRIFIAGKELNCLGRDSCNSIAYVDSAAVKVIYQMDLSLDGVVVEAYVVK